MKPAGNKLADYIRVSSDKQDTQRQREAIDGWAARFGLPILFHFQDSEGRNPRDQSAKRADFQALLKAVEAGKVDTIIVDAQDRFGTKDAFEWGKFIYQLRENDCELWSADRGLLSGDDDTSVLYGTLGAMNSKREQIDKANRNLGGKIAKARRGEYQGGYPPFGFDVACFGTDGKEKWRVEYIGGHYQREKVYLDGRRERFDGKGNFPAKDPSDVWRYRPTINAERLAAARQIFEWYASEDVSPMDIANRLAKLGITPTTGDTWYGVKIRPYLQHPIYIGFPTFNKRAGSRFREYLNGQLQDVPSNGKGKQGRRRQPSDFIQPPAPEFPPIVSAEVWQKVQAKLKATSFAATGRKHRPARTADLAKLWLRPFLYCGKCGKPMRANTPLNGKNSDKTAGLTYASYTCGSYGTYGRNNPAGCRCHRVKAELLDSIVEKYIADAAPHLREMQEATESGNSALFDAAFERLAVTLYSRNQLAAELIKATGKDWNPQNLAGSYGPAYMRRLPEIDRALAAKEKTLEEMLEGFRTLSSRLRERANRQMETLLDEIETLNRQRQDLRMPWDSICNETRQRVEAMELAAQSFGSNDNWQTAEALRGVIDRIVCHFRYTGKSGESTKAKSFLDSVEIYPAGGTPVTLPNDGKQARG